MDNWHPNVGELVRVLPTEVGKHDGFSALIVAVKDDVIRVIEVERSRFRFVRPARIGRLTAAHRRSLPDWVVKRYGKASDNA